MKCLNCESDFISKPKYKKKFCCGPCARKYWNKTHKKECKIIRENFFKRNSITPKKYNRNHYSPEYYLKHKDEIIKKKKEWRRKNGEKYKNQRKRWRERNRDNILEKYKSKSRNKARQIKIPKNQLCNICLGKIATEKHHENYNRPLEVKFLCVKCHKKIHSKYKSVRRLKNDKLKK